MNESLPFSPASERNRQPILEVLHGVFSGHGIMSGVVLEIGSGTGQHVVYFAREFPALKWLPTDRYEGLPDLMPRLQQVGCENIFNPVVLDVLRPWPELTQLRLGTGPAISVPAIDVAYSANTAHIMSWQAVCAMFEGVGECLRDGGVFCLYGPFNEGGQFTSPSNAAFDRQLRSRDDDMGLRDVEAIETLANNHQMMLTEKVVMPANNQVLVFVRQNGSK